MANQNHPGVYVEEIVTLGASVASVPTAIPGFTGYTEKAPFINGSPWGYGSAEPAPPVRITSLLEYKQVFGGPQLATYDVALSGTLESPIVAVTPTLLPTHTLYYNLQMYFANGGGVCYVVSAGLYATITAAHLIDGIAKLAQIDEVTLLVTPEAIHLASSNVSALRKSVYTAMIDQCANSQDRFALLDVAATSAGVSADGTSFRSYAVGTESLKYAAAYYPALKTSIAYEYLDGDVHITADSINTTTYAGQTLEVVHNGRTSSPANVANKAHYNLIKAEIAKTTLALYPSAAMAGVYARVDNARGVWKAPANTSLNMVSAPSVLVTDEEQNDLNISAGSGKSINAIRQFTGKGTIVWGARTLAGNDNEWKYINVRRLFIYVEESIKKATEFVVFEPNTASTWSRVKSMCEAFLTGLWRDGGLAGANPKDAFFVRIGLGNTMTADDILNGKLIIEIGMAASRPAEFIILRFSHKLQES